MTTSGQHIPYDRQLFVFLTGEQMSIPHGHGDVLVTHELLQFHERNFTRLRQPACERMPHGVQRHSVQTVAIFRGQIELSDGGLETGGRFVKGSPLAGKSVPLACVCTPEASESYLQVHGQKLVCHLSE